ncbi:flavin-containing monooxygenase [Halomarina ordinaria]|uniref:Flavin-containing monooxygenase n=1 Tax=Halomarina ordinaria TaxID=3033939 RepID=A0ABD5U4B1_9EURY|nr:NAD(P)/FAD-dependent oxidoreductase [Halomarina sp. PSRA2]
MSEQHTADGSGEADLDVAIVGAGFSGLYMLHRLRGLGLSARVFEKADDVGGTWYWNRYPGARCDSESHIYCYSFSDALLDEWEWSERYPEQPEVLRYLRYAADHLDLRRDVEFETEVTSAVFEEDSGTWTVSTDDGSQVSARFFVTAVGCLSKPYLPDFDGLESFEGEWYHTGRWPHDPVDFDGKRVAVVGTGASGIQAIPEIADDAGHLTVFQRTPNYAVPARNRPLTPAEYDEIRERYDEIWAQSRDSGFGMPFDTAAPTAADLSTEAVREVLEPRWQEGGFRFLLAFEDLLINEETNRKVSEFIRSKIRETVDDPEVAATLVPTDHPYASKRPPLHTDYYETYNRDHVRLVSVRESPIEELTPEGIRTADEHHAFDTVVFATGFDAMTGTLFDMDIEGKDGTHLEEKWADGPRTYLGLAVHDFPNMFTITGPQSPSVLTNMPVSIEQHVEWIADCIEYMEREDLRVVEPTEAAEEEWVAHSNEVADQTLYSEADSWYRGENIPGKPRIFTPYAGGLDLYRQQCAEVAANDYEGFDLGESADATTAD